MKSVTAMRDTPSHLLIGASIILIMVASNRGHAHEDYGGCAACHGDFRGSTSTKGTVFPSNNNHEMHRASGSMDTECNICHIGSSRLPVLIGSSTGTANNAGLGCTGCHVAPGLRNHHLINGVTECLDCHDPETAPGENVKPPYYGTVDTKANNPGNTVQASNTNENWSVGDFLGLDNDGNNLYDLADYTIGPYHLVSVNRVGNDVRVGWLTAGGRTNIVQAAGAVAGSYLDVSIPLVIPGVGLISTNYVEVGGATNLARFYRLRSETP